MSSTDVTEIVYHCECRRFVAGPAEISLTCPECGRDHGPDQKYCE